MKRREYYGARAKEEHAKAVAWYADSYVRCGEECPLCGVLDCETAWMDTEMDESEMEYEG